MSEAVRAVVAAARRLEAEDLLVRCDALIERAEEVLPELGEEHAGDDVKRILVELRVLGDELWQRSRELR